MTYPDRLGAQYTGLDTQTLASEKGFLTFYLKIFFKHPRRSVSLFNLRNLENVLQRYLRTGTTRECILEHLEAQGLKISSNHGDGKGEGELQDVTGLSKKLWICHCKL